MVVINPFKKRVEYFDTLEVNFLGKTGNHWCFFSCLPTRAVHIKVVDGPDTETFMMAVMRFIAGQGRLHRISSDNGTNFIGSARNSRNWRRN